MRNGYMIRCDMEGVSGVVSFDQVYPGRSEYAFGQKMFMNDLLALVEGLHEGGAGHIVLYDEHYDGRNIELSLLPDYTAAICGKAPYRLDSAGGLDGSFKGVVLLGFHSKAGTPGGLLAHSYELDIKDLVLNGTSVGEIGIHAAIAGDFGVPIILVVGDSAGAAEAETLLPGVATVVVKESLSESAGACYPLSVTREKIRRAAREVVETPPSVKPYRLGDKVTLEIELDDKPYLKAMRKLFPDNMASDTTLRLEGQSATEVWIKYREMQLSCQA